MRKKDNIDVDIRIYLYTINMLIHWCEHFEGLCYDINLKINKENCLIVDKHATYTTKRIITQRCEHMC